jgi:predicted ribosomally synthesized peptide with nif11-like leader
MNASAIEEFKEKVLASSELQSKFSEAGSVEEFVEITVRVGAENGYSFSTEDVRLLLESQQDDSQLSEQDLTAVAGGAISYGNSIFCGYCGPRSGTYVSKLAP